MNATNNGNETMNANDLPLKRKYRQGALETARAHGLCFGYDRHTWWLVGTLVQLEAAGCIDICGPADKLLPQHD